MDAETNVVSGTKGRESSAHKYRVIGCAGMLYVFSSMLLIRKYMPILLDKLPCTNDWGWINNMRREPTVYWWTNQTYTLAEPEVTSIDGWERNVSRDTAMYIDPFSDTTIIPGKEICGNHHRKLVIIVTTSPSQSSERTLIRETWGSGKGTDVKIGFLVGLSRERSIQISLKEENNQFKDIIQEDFIDTYSNLTLKSISLLKWYVQNCRHSPFLMKSDADTFVNVGLLVNQLANYSTHGILMGYLCKKCDARRRAGQRWAVPRYMYPHRTYPDYVFGYAYIMTRDVAAKLFAAALKTPLFYLEDVFITGLCAREAGMAPQQFPGSAEFHESENIEELCLPNHTICNPISPEVMRYLWKTRCSPKRMNVPN